MSTESRPVARHPGAALAPAGENPMLSGLGPGAWAERADVPDRTVHGAPRVVPLRVATDFFLEPRDPDPRGMTVVGADGLAGGAVTDVWVDRSEPAIRYLEVDAADRRVLVPITSCKFDPRARQVRVKAILSTHFAQVPATASPDVVTLREEDRIMAFFAAGYLWATPQREGPVI